jgi:hypothetical protein
MVARVALQEWTVSRMAIDESDEMQECCCISDEEAKEVIKMLNLDEAIRHCEEVAVKLEEKANIYGIKETYIPDSRNLVDCMSCAAEHRQLAEWLKELKTYKANADGITAVSDILKEENDRLRETVNRFDSENKEAIRLLLLACADIHALLTDAELTTKNCKLCGKLSLCNESGTTCKSGGVWVHEKAVMKLIGDTDNDT